MRVYAMPLEKTWLLGQFPNMQNCQVILNMASLAPYHFTLQSYPSGILTYILKWWRSGKTTRNLSFRVWIINQFKYISNFFCHKMKYYLLTVLLNLFLPENTISCNRSVTKMMYYYACRLKKKMDWTNFFQEVFWLKWNFFFTPI